MELELRAARNIIATVTAIGVAGVLAAKALPNTENCQPSPNPFKWASCVLIDVPFHFNSKAPQYNMPEPLDVPRSGEMND